MRYIPSVRIAQITLAAADPAAQADFWGGRLGLPVREDGSAVEVVLRRSAIRFEPAAEGKDTRYHFAINVPRGSIEEAAAWLGGRHQLLEFHGDPDYVEAMSYGMAPNGGCGVGVDRLAMILLGKDTIRDVILFPALRARD